VVIKTKGKSTIKDILYTEVINYKAAIVIFSLIRDSVWGLMTGAANESSSSLVMHEVREIETWILRLLSAPVPVPGKTRVEVSC